MTEEQQYDDVLSDACSGGVMPETPAPSDPAAIASYAELATRLVDHVAAEKIGWESVQSGAV